MTTTQGPSVLLILDGWGHRADADHNAIAIANTPVWDSLMTHAAHTLIHTSGLQVGLPEGQMGNSEVGHMNLGAGRVVYQSLTRINKS
ncbi:MAG TPA: 2,3-bisphosphoglycerate-independent phosphoglycerate mutase, partial [Hyphomicrobiales bacterium]|nr:2,3-bisphosphoglycerate-independent phosphoglycerate mutase [Hyphomicrobiales bacterium]